MIYGAEETDDWTDPKVWKKANPSLGITVSIDKVQQPVILPSRIGRRECVQTASTEPMGQTSSSLDADG